MSHGRVWLAHCEPTARSTARGQAQARPSPCRHVRGHDRAIFARICRRNSVCPSVCRLVCKVRAPYSAN